MNAKSPLDVLRTPASSVNLAERFDFQQMNVEGVSLNVDADARQRIAAADQIATLGPAGVDAIPFLIAMLDQDRISGTSDDLVAAFSSGNATVEDGRKAENMTRVALADAACHAHASDALARIGAAAVPALTEALNAATPNRRGGAAKALGKIGAPAESALPVLVRLSKADPAETVRKASAGAIKQIKPRRWFSF